MKLDNKKVWFEVYFDKGMENRVIKISDDNTDIFKMRDIDGEWMIDKKWFIRKLL